MFYCLGLMGECNINKVLKKESFLKVGFAVCETGLGGVGGCKGGFSSPFPNDPY